MEIAPSNRPSRANHPTSRLAHQTMYRQNVKKEEKTQCNQFSGTFLTASRHVTLERQAKVFFLSPPVLSVLRNLAGPCLSVLRRRFDGPKSRPGVVAHALPSPTCEGRLMPRCPLLDSSTSAAQFSAFGLLEFLLTPKRSGLATTPPCCGLRTRRNTHATGNSMPCKQPHREKSCLGVKRSTDINPQ